MKETGLLFTTDKLPPHDLDSEEAVLGSILIDSDQIKMLTLSTADFYHEPHSFIYNVMLKLKEEGVGIDQITVAQRLNETDKLEPSGGAGYLSHLVAITPSSLDCQHYAEIVQRLSNSRRLIAAGEAITRVGYEAGPDTAGAVAKADKILLDVRKTAGGSHIITPEDRDRILMDRYGDLYEKEKGIAVETGLIDLDKRLGGGLFPGDLIVLGARPGVGKTTMLKTITNHIGSNNNVLFCTAEMDTGSLGDRDVAGQLGIPVDTVRLGNYDDTTMDGILSKALPWISTQQIYTLDFTRGFQITTTNIYQSAFEIKERHGLSLIVVDYLGLLTDKYGNNNNDRIGFITRTLKAMAMTLDVPMLVAHQLNRAADMRPDEQKRPQLSDLRDSGNVEQDADVVMFLYRESYYKKESDNNETEILIAKKRQGESGRRVKVLWDNKHQTYRNLAWEGE